MSNVEQELILTNSIRAGGKIIRSIFEAPYSTQSDDPIIIVVPPYGRTMCDMFATALYLTKNGLRVWRFDFTNHIGASDGEIFDFTLSSAIDDLKTVVGAVRHQYEKSSIGIISSSLGSRAAFRALKKHQDLRGLVSLVGVINVQDTLSRILGVDFVRDILNGQTIPSSWEILGYTGSTRFINDAIEYDLYSLDSTKRDLSECNFPIAQISAESDPWISLSEIESVFRPDEGSRPRELYVLPGASHKLENNPAASRNALRQAVRIFKQYLTGKKIDLGEVLCPSFQEIVEKNRQERRLEKRGHGTGHSEMTSPMAL